MQIRDLAIEIVPTSSLRRRKRNPRTHPRKQIKQIAASVERFGWTVPILVDEEGSVLAGHGRLEAAILLGLVEVPAIRISALTPEQARAYVLADNKLTENAGWDEQLLGEELADLLKLDANFSIEITGFTEAEVDRLVEGLHPEEPGDPDDDVIPDPGDCPARCQAGDIWRLGPHRLICGDALDGATVHRLMDGEMARMAFSDPPYNLRIADVVGSGRIKHREFVMASGEMTREEFTAFLKTALENMAVHSVDGAIHFICMDWRHAREIIEAGEQVYTELKNLIVWVKDNGGMGTFYRSRHELIFVFKVGNAPNVNSFELGQFGRYRTNVWQYRGVNTFKTGRMDDLSLHPSCKPVQMIADAIKDVSARNDIILDTFGGAGATLIAAHKTGRRAFVCEIDPIYCNRILQRWETFAKDEAERLVAGSSETGSRP